MHKLFTILTIAFSVATFVSAADGPDLPLNPKPASPYLLLAAMICLFAAIILGKRNAKRQAIARARVREEMAVMPSKQQIDEALERLRRVIDGESEPMPQPPDGAIVACEECKVTEHYTVGNDAAKSTHLNTHPERCRVVL